MECCIALNQEGLYGLNGDFNKFTIPNYDRSIRTLFKAQSPSTLDLNQVSSCDSALVALLISYKHDYPELQLVSIPSQLEKLLSLYNVRDWFN